MGNLINKITLADCMDVMNDMPDKCIDLAIVDPPYGIGYSSSFDTRECKPLPKRKAHIKRGFYKKGNWDDSIPDKKYFTELFRVSTNQIIWGGNYYSEHLKSSKGWVVWDKEKKIPTYADGEMAWTSFDKPLKIFYFLWDGFKQAQYYRKNSPVQGNHKIKEKRFHPTQKPAILYRWLLQNYAKPGQLILDTHSGSGSLACACHLEKFDFIAIEKDVDYHRDSVNRLDELRSQGLLF